MNVNITIFWNRLLVKLKAPEQTTASGIVLPNPDENKNIFEVIRVGDKVTEAKEWNFILVGERYGDIVTIENQEYKIIHQDAILAVIG